MNIERRAVSGGVCYWRKWNVARPT